MDPIEYGKKGTGSYGWIFFLEGVESSALSVVDTAKKLVAKQLSNPK